MAIEQLNRGDSVIAIDRFGRGVNRRVVKRSIYHSQPVSLISFEDGTTLRVTDHHTVKSADGWKQVRDLEVGQQLEDVCEASLSFRKIIHIQRNVSVETVYNLVVEGDCTFVADGIVAHSFSDFRAVRVLLQRILFAITDKPDVEAQANPRVLGLT